MQCGFNINGDVGKIIIAYLEKSNKEYLDDVIQFDPRKEIFWSLGCLSGKLLEWYPFDELAEVMVAGDVYGALTGVLSEKAGSVTVYADADEQEVVLKKRYVKRDNIFIFHSPSDSEHLEQKCREKKYDFSIINHHPLLTEDELDHYIVAKMAQLGTNIVKEEGKILIVCLRREIALILKIYKEYGYAYYNVYDPLKMGLYVIEISKKYASNKVSYLYSNIELSQYMGTNLWMQRFGKFRLDQNCIGEDGEVLARVIDIELELLRVLKELCSKHGLKMYPMYGTLLGTVRGTAMIPGDDDIDVALPREDYDRLLSIAPTELPPPFFLQTPFNDNCFYGGYSKLRNCSTTSIIPQNWWVDSCEGIGIDIFPIDNGFINPIKENRKRRKIQHLQRMLYAKAYGYYPRFKDMKLLKWKAYKYWGKLFTRKQLAEKLNMVLASGDSDPQAPFGIYTHYSGKGVFPRLFDRKAFVSDYEFLYEDVWLNVPCGWDMILKSLYGNYLEPWEKGDRKLRHGFYNPDVSYKDYIKHFHGLHRPGPSIGQEIVLFGDGTLFQAYLKRYAKKCSNPVKIVVFDGYYDLYFRELVSSKIDIPVISMREFHVNDLDSIYPIICAADVREAEMIIKKAGFSEYYFYWENRDWMLFANVSEIRKEVKSLCV